MKLLDEARIKLKREVNSLTTSSWFILPVKQKYGKIIQTIDSIKKYLNKKDISLFRDKIQSIKDFSYFRLNLLKAIAGTNMSVENSKSAKSKRLLCDSQMSELFKLNLQKANDEAERFRNSTLNSVDRTQFIEDLTSLIEYLEHQLTVFVKVKEKKLRIQLKIFYQNLLHLTTMVSVLTLTLNLSRKGNL